LGANTPGESWKKEMGKGRGTQGGRKLLLSFQFEKWFEKGGKKYGRCRLGRRGAKELFNKRSSDSQTEGPKLKLGQIDTIFDGRSRERDRKNK